MLCVGLNETLEGEEGDTGNSYASGDKLDLLLPPPQRDLMQALAETGTPVVLCLMTGSAIDLTFADENFDAVLQLWYPGARGGLAAAKVLFGEVSPSGKLNVTFYHDDDPLPDFEDYSMKGRTYRYLEKEPLYPFGYGLSYGDVTVTGAAYSPGSMLVKWENKSAVPTEEVIQIYVKAEDDPLAPPNPRLCGFKRISAGAGESGESSIKLDPHVFEVIDEDGNRVPAKGKMVLYAGTSQPDARSLALTGKDPVKLEIEK